jgi:hypothetical protein
MKVEGEWNTIPNSFLYKQYQNKHKKQEDQQQGMLWKKK